MRVKEWGLRRRRKLRAPVAERGGGAGARDSPARGSGGGGATGGGTFVGSPPCRVGENWGGTPWAAGAPAVSEAADLLVGKHRTPLAAVWRALLWLTVMPGILTAVVFLAVFVIVEAASVAAVTIPLDTLRACLQIPGSLAGVQVPKLYKTYTRRAVLSTPRKARRTLSMDIRAPVR